MTTHNAMYRRIINGNQFATRGTIRSQSPIREMDDYHQFVGSESMPHDERLTKINQGFIEEGDALIKSKKAYKSKGYIHRLINGESRKDIENLSYPDSRQSKLDAVRNIWLEAILVACVDGLKANPSNDQKQQ